MTSQAEPAFVESRVAFVNEEWRDRSDIPRIHSRSSRHANTSQHDVVIQNARLRSDLDLDESGFVLLNDDTHIERARDKAHVRATYFPKMRELIRSLTGAHDVLDIGFFQVRSREPESFFDAYSLYMHCDYDVVDWGPFVKGVLRQNDKDYPENAWHFASYNVWRPLFANARKNPLVVMDASTLDRADIIHYSPTDKTEGPVVALPLYNESQRLYYVPDMRPDEVLIIKQLDTRPGKAVVSPHTSFVDPTTPPDAPERTSIDIRFLCVFPKGEDRRASC